MKWGVRRYQNKDGTLTAAGKKRAAKLKSEYTQITGKQMRRTPSTSSAETSQPQKKELTLQELRERNAYLQEQINYNSLYSQLHPRQVSFGQKVAKSLGDATVKALGDAIANTGKSWVEKKLKDSMGLNEPKKKTALERLQETADINRLQKESMMNLREIQRMNEDPDYIPQSGKKKKQK